MFRTIGKVDQVESFGGRRVTNPLQPDLRSPFGVSPVDFWVLADVSAARRVTDVCAPMEHDPLGDSDNALLGLVQSRKLGLDGIICVCHSDERSSEPRSNGRQ